MTSHVKSHPSRYARFGDTVWVLDFLVGDPARGEWCEAKITGETRTSLILGDYRSGYEISKSTGKFRGHDHRPLGGVEFTREAVDARIAANEEYVRKKAARKLNR